MTFFFSNTDAARIFLPLTEQVPKTDKPLLLSEAGFLGTKTQNFFDS